MLSAFIAGLSGPELSPREAAVLREARPCGVILFTRNAVEPEKVRRLTEAAKGAIGTEAILVLVDQEGGRVQRLKPPRWRALPPAIAYAAAYGRDAAAALKTARLAARLTASDLTAVGINTNCAPVLDVPVSGGHDVIGDRAYGAEPRQVAALGRAVAEGLIAGGVLPVMKHVPGHGRATKDSHYELPLVEATLDDLDGSDFAPFRDLAGLPAAMTAHVVFTAVDPDHPASTSSRVISEIVRTRIGFDGLLISDDLGMKALSGSISARAKAVLDAGSDVALLCSGDLAETESVAATVPPLRGASLARFERAHAVLRQQEAFDVAEAEACVASILRAAA
jgi:beta-N-acetylhexosaminidase